MLTIPDFNEKLILPTNIIFFLVINVIIIDLVFQDYKSKFFFIKKN